MIDLGHWADEKYAVPVAQTDLDDLEKHDESGESESDDAPDDSSKSRNRDLH